MSMEKAYIDGLLEERRQLVAAHKTGRVAQIDIQLAALGHEPPATRPQRREATRPADGSPAAPTPPTVAAAGRETTRAALPDHTAEPQPDDHVCGTCGRTFRTAAALGSHQRTHRS